MVSHVSAKSPPAVAGAQTFAANSARTIRPVGTVVQNTANTKSKANAKNRLPTLAVNGCDVAESKELTMRD